MKRVLIYLTITVAIFTLITAVLMFSTSGTAPIKLYWAVDCTTDTSCNLIISGHNFIGEVEGNESNATEPVNSYYKSGSITPETAYTIDKPSKVPWYSERSKITSVTLGGDEDTIVPANMLGWFYGMEKLTNIDFSHVDSSAVGDNPSPSASNNMSYLFYGCTRLASGENEVLDLTPLRINSSMAGSSEEVFSYTYIDTIKFKSKNDLLYFEYGFWEEQKENVERYFDDEFAEALSSYGNNEEVTYKNVSPKYYYNISDGVLTITGQETSGYNWNYESAKNTWFDKYSGEMVSNITSVVVNNFEPLSMRNLFTDLTNAESITFNNVNTEYTIDMHELFVNCKKLKKLDLSSFNTTGLLVQPTSSSPSRLFINCFSLKEVKIGTNFGYTLSEGTWISQNSGNQYRDGVILTNVNDTYTRSALYWGVTNNTLKISNNYFNASHSGTFDYLDENLYYGEPQNPHEPYIPWSSYASSVTSIEIGGENDIIKPVYMDSWFVGFKQVPSIDLTHLDTSLVVSMELTFAEMKALKTIDLSNLDFSNLVNASSMFSACINLESINLANFNPPKLESTGYMFSYCKKLKEVDLTSFEGDSLYYTEGMFEDTYDLKRIKIPYMKMQADLFSSEYDYADMFVPDNLNQIQFGKDNLDLLRNQIIAASSSGSWYDAQGTLVDVAGLNSSDITVFEIYATEPFNVVFKDSETNQILSENKYTDGSVIRLNVPSTKANAVETFTTSFVTDSNETVDPINSKKTTTFNLTGYTSGENTYDINSEYTVTSDVVFTTVYTANAATYETITLPSITRFGYVFEGWSISNPPNGLLKPGAGYTPEASIKLYAIWEKIEHTYLDISEKVTFTIGKTKSLVYRISGDMDTFKDLYVGDNKLTRDTHYTVTSGSTVITFTEAGIRYLESLPPATYQIRAIFNDTNDVSVSSLSIEEVGKHNVTVHYKYSGVRSDEKVFDDFNEQFEEGQAYRITSQTKEYYKYDIAVVEGTMGKESVEVTVTYTPIKDKNKDGYADEEKPVKASNNEASPKTQDNIIKYVVLELLSLLAAVIIFIRIKAR